MPFTPPSMGVSDIPKYTTRLFNMPGGNNLETAPGSNTFVWQAPPVEPPANALSPSDIQAVRGAFAPKGIDPFPWFGQNQGNQQSGPASVPQAPTPSNATIPNYMGPQTGSSPLGSGDTGNIMGNAAQQFGNATGSQQPSLPPTQPQFQSPLGNYEYPFKQGVKSPQYPF